MSLEWDIEELAGYVLGESEERIDELINDGEIHELLAKKYGVDFDTYYEIVKDLLPFTPKVQAGISGGKYHAFLHPTKPVMIVKIPACDRASK